MGVNALVHNTTGNLNIAIGDDAEFNTTGSSNVTVGAGNNGPNGITTGSNNTCLGNGAGLGITGGGNNTCLGQNAGSNLATASGNIYIGNGVNPPGPGFEFNTVRIGDNLPTDAGASACFIGGILSHHIPQMSGNPIVTIDLVTQQIGYTTDFADKLTEQQKKIEEQQASITQLKSEMHTMVAQLKEQAAQIQRVSAQLQVSKPAPQVVANKP
jgi:hypothetical protein